MSKSRLPINVIGHASHGSTVASILHSNSGDVVVIEPDDNINESFDLNGVRYVPIKAEKRHPLSPKSFDGFFLPAVMLLSMPYMYETGSPRERRLPRGTNIVAEYGLIQKKESRMSRWERDEVVSIFEANFRRV